MLEYLQTFILFFLIGYISHRNISLKQALAGVTVAAIALLVPTAVFFPDFIAYTGLSSEALILAFMSTIILSLVIIAVAAFRWKEWRSYAVAAVVGQAAGAGFTFGYSLGCQPPFPNVSSQPDPSLLHLVLANIRLDYSPLNFPSFCLLGPPIIKACYRAFPSLRSQVKPSDRN